ncbi:MAG: SIS domain-containing protein [Candidatus Delongbacteria bacterium]|nr:SIS domain-containing protein [Candidatus Delongbacteria bacterium]
MKFAQFFFEECRKLVDEMDTEIIERMAQMLAEIRQNGGRLFLLGSGGGAGHASHAACDFRKLCDIQTYAVYDNVSELTARVNDEGWDVTIRNWLKVSRLNNHDAVLIFSVGGGNQQKNISLNLVKAVEYARECGAKVLGIVGKDGGYTKQVGDAVCVIPNVNPDYLTPLTEGFQAVIWHLLVSHPALKAAPAKWESSL